MKPAPQKPIINQEGRTLIAPYATAYQWYLEGKRIFNSTSREHYIQDGKIGNYTVLVYNEFNCSTLSDEFQVITSVDNNILNDFIVTVNNNPGTGDYLINFSEPIVGGLIILVTDVNGREIASITENLDNLKNYRLNLTQFSTGIYFANIKANGQSKLLKLIRN